MFRDWHVKLEWPDCGESSKDLVFTPARERRQTIQQCLAVFGAQIRSQLELVLTKWRRSHVALEMLTRGLVVHRHRHQPRDLSQRDAFLARRGGGRGASQNFARRGWGDAAAHGIGTSGQRCEQHQNKSSFAMCVSHKSSSASSAVDDAHTLLAQGGSAVTREPLMRSLHLTS